MRRLILIAVCGLGVVSVAAGCARRRAEVVSEGPPPAQGWQRLGTRTVNGRGDRDVLPVTARQGTFRQLRYEVSGSALEMYDVVVNFGNGDRFSPQTRLVFGRGSDSRIIDLPGDSRIIRDIVFRYGNLPGGKRAHVTVYAK